MGEYANAVVYKITTSDSIYVGSTKNFQHRWLNHKYALHNENSHAYNLKLYQTIRANNDEWEMVIIKECPGTNKIELLMEEQKYIDELKPDLNCINSHTDRVEYMKKYGAEWYQENKEKVKKASANYRLEHKEKIILQKAEWYQNNIERERKIRTDNYQKNKINILNQQKERIECECGCNVCKGALTRHKKTKRHIDLMILKNT